MARVHATPLADAFLADREATAEDRARLDTSLRQAFADAARAYADVSVDTVSFARHLGGLLQPADDLLAGLAALRIDDLWLCFACASGASGGIATFETQILARLDAAIAGAGASPERIDEVKQRLREKLFVDHPERPAKIAAYHGRGSLRNWVRVIAVREALALLERDHRVVEPDDDALEASLEIDRDPELAFLKGHYRTEFSRSFADALAAMTSRDRTVLRLQHVDRLTLDQTAAVLNVHRATIARWNARIREELLIRTRDSLGRRLKIDAGEFESIMRLIQSNLEVSVRRLLAPE